MMRRTCAVLVAGVLVIALAGCATKNPPAPQPGVGSFHSDPDLQWVWIADGFSFRGYDALHVEEPEAQVAKVEPDGVDNLAWARGVLRDEMAAALRIKGTFPTVTAGPLGSRPAAAGRTLRLQTTIVEYEKGGGAARWWAGGFGAGQPVIRVRGRVMDGNRLVCSFETRRSAETFLARRFGGYRSDKAIQEEDIKSLANGLANFVVRDGEPRG